ncbi:MAG: DUF523 domain-containing protein [Candidatus Binatia bacterium]
MRRPVLGVSSCLLGNRVRWDGGDKKLVPLLDALSSRAVLVALCPEIEMGMGVPRKPLTIVRQPRARLVSTDGQLDLTAAMENLVGFRITELKRLKVCGYIMKSGSPSCGLGDARCVDGSGVRLTGADGFFLAAIKRSFPGIPLSTDKELDDRVSCLRFLERAARYGDAVEWAR